MHRSYLAVWLALLIITFSIGPAVSSIAAPSTVASQQAAQLNVQKFLDGQPGILKSYRDGEYSAAQVVQSYTSYYNLDPRIILTLLELGPQLLTNQQPAPETVRAPFGAAGPDGFARQVEWAVREIRAGFGPYTAAPVVRFTDGSRTTLSLDQDASFIAVQRFLAQGRTQSEWKVLVDRYQPLHTKLWGNQPNEPTPTPSAVRPFLKLPWPAGIEVVHSSYFDHVYPTVDRGGDDNSFIVNYLGRGNLSYNTHDGHDYYFPAMPIGTPILAAAPGIAYAYTTPGNGVVIRHGGEYAGYETVYWHLDQFALIFQNKIGNGVGVPVEAGTPLGISGKSGFTDGGAHLHFEVRHNGKQVDPYGWYGPGPDPCAAWSAGCEASVWLWDDSLSGTYDFTRPDAPAPQDHEPPVGTLAVAPDIDLALLAHFDTTVVPTIGQGFPQINARSGGRPAYDDGIFGQGVHIAPSLELSYPISGNLELERGTLALWARLPDEYPANNTQRHYLFAASANPENGETYTNTLALRRQISAVGSRWNFWTVDDQGQTHNLLVTDTLTAGWHHFAVSWDRTAGHKALFIDGQAVAQTNAATLPTALGERLQLGRFIAGFGASDVALDELAIFRRSLGVREIARLAAKKDVYTDADGPIGAAKVVTDRTVLLDANAIDPQGGIVSVQLRRNDEPWSDPLPYHDAYRWTITGPEGQHTFAIRYRDRADNETVVTTTLELQPTLQGAAAVRSKTDTAVVLGLNVNEEVQGTGQLTEQIEQQISTHADFRNSPWEPFSDVRVWNWRLGERREVYIRFRDKRGRISTPQLITLEQPVP